MNKTIIEIINSPAFKRDLSDYIEYATNIKLERLIAYSLNKFLIQRKVSSTLEKDKSDIVAGNIKIEVKFHFDFDIVGRLQSELKNVKSLKSFFEKHNASDKSKTWSVLYGASKDILDKKCGQFIWIISERDANKYFSKLPLNEVCYGKYLKAYEENLKIDKKFDKILRLFSQKLAKTRAHTLDHITINIKSPYKTTFHFFLFKF